MTDEPDPPRKIYGLKPRDDFERHNPPGPPTGPVPTDVHDLIASAQTADLATKGNAPVNRPNDVHALLQHNLERANSAGLNRVALDPNHVSKQQRRIRRFILFVLLFDLPVGAYAFWIGHENAVVFTFTVAAIAYFTTRLAWQTFFLNTE